MTVRIAGIFIPLALLGAGGVAVSAQTPGTGATQTASSNMVRSAGHAASNSVSTSRPISEVALPPGLTSFPDYTVGSIPSETVYFGQTLSFKVESPNTGDPVKVSFNPAPNGAAGFVSPQATGNPTPGPNTGSGNLFTYTPTQQDKFEFTATFTSGATTQAVLITPVPTLQPEYDIIQTKRPLPDETSGSYINYTETSAVSSVLFNGQPPNGKFTTRSIEISGKTITLDANSDPAGLMAHLTSPNSNIAQLTIYAETLIIRSAITLPQTNVTIYAGQLIFQDPANSQAGTANINTTPLACSGLNTPNWCTPPADAAADSSGNVATPAGDGISGTKAGSVTLHIQQFTSTSDSLPVTGGAVDAVRFILDGGRGQDPGKGYNGQNGNDMNYVTKFPAGSRTSGSTTCSWGDIMPPYGVVYGEIVCVGQTFPFPGASARTFPGDGKPAAAWGKPGSGGDGGDISSSVPLGATVSQVGGFAGALGSYAVGGRGGLPNPAYWYRIPGGIFNTNHQKDQPTLAPPLPDKFSGATGNSNMLSDASYTWLHPYAMRMILTWTKDAYRDGNLDTARSTLKTYLPILQAASGGSDSAQFTQFVIEAQELLNRIDSNLDYYGNPAGWVPLLSLQSNMTLLNQEVTAAIPIIYLSERIQSIAATQQQTLDSLKQSWTALETEVTQTVNDYSQVEGNIQTLQGQASALAQQVTLVQAQIAGEQLALEQEAKSNVAAASQLPFWESAVRILAKACEVLPIYQPVLGLVGSGLDFLTNIDTSQPLNTIEQGYKIASQFNDANFTASQKQLNDLLGKLDPSNINSISDFAKNATSVYNTLAPGIDKFRQALQQNGVPQDAVQAELAKLTAQDSTLSSLVSMVNDLNSQKAANALALSKAVDQLTKDTDTINADLNSIANYQQAYNTQISAIDHATTIYIKDMERRQLDRLQKYLYYMSKAYEYRLLKPYPGNIRLDDLLTKLKQMLKAGNNTLSQSDIAALVSIYEDQVRAVIADGIDQMQANPPQQSQQLRFGLTADELKTLNTSGAVIINLDDKIGGLPNEENRRIADLGILGPADSGLTVQSNSGDVSTGTLDLSVEYFGQSTISSQGHTYFFRFGTPQFENPFTWGATYDLVDQTFHPQTLSVDGLSLLSTFLNAPAGLSQFAEPGADSLITIRRTVIPGSVNAAITKLRMYAQIDFYPANANQVSVTVQAPPSAYPYVSVDRQDITGRSDGIGSFTRVYASQTGINLAAENTYGGLKFLKWVDANNTTVTTSPTLSLTVNGDQVLTPLYEAAANFSLPGAFSLSSPTNGSSNTPGLTLSWSASNGATSYDVYLGTTNPPTAVVRNTMGTAYTPSNLRMNTTYYWTVVAKNSQGTTAAPQIWSFLMVLNPNHCTYTLNPPSASFPSSGGTASFSVQMQGTCSVTAATDDTWVHVTSANPLATSGSFTYTVDPNNGPSGRSTLLGLAGIPGLGLTITQTGNSPSAGLTFVSLPPCRVMETRSAYNFEGRTGAFGPPFLKAGETRTLNLPESNVCQIPVGAKAYALNLTLIPHGEASNVLTVFPADETRPRYQSIAEPDAQTVGNAAIVRATNTGGIGVYVSDDSDVLIDISGYFTDNRSVSNLVYYPLTPCRVLETRVAYRTPGPFGPPSMAAGETRSFRLPDSPYCTVPKGAAAYSLTITAVPQGPLPFLSIWPSTGLIPNVSSLNSFDGRTIPNSVIVPASPDGNISINTYSQTDVFADITGYFAPDDGQTGLFYYPITQCVAADTSDLLYNTPFGGPAFAEGGSRSLAIPSAPFCSSIPTSAKGYALTVKVDPAGETLPFVTVYPTGVARPNASMVNDFQGTVVTNSSIVPAGPNGSIDVFAFTETDLSVEITGYFSR